MNNSLRQGEISTIVVLGTLVVIGVVTLLNTTLNKTPQIVQTKAQVPAVCPYDSGNPIQLGQTESDPNNTEARWPISENRHEYDFFSYFTPATEQEARDSNMTVYPKEQYLTYDVQSGGMDSNLSGMMGKMFGYKPTRLIDAYFMKYMPSTPRGADTLVKGIAPAIKVPIVPGDPVYMPDTLYSIGSNMEAMVVFAATDRITLHIGRSEYLVGSGVNNCNGSRCSGGIWLYIRGICVDRQILDKYNSVSYAQETAGANKNPITLPMVEANRVLGKATGDAVEVIMRDNGPLLSIYKPGFWTGVPVKDVSLGNPTTIPTPTTIVLAPTATSIGPTSVIPTMTLIPTITATPVPVEIENAPESTSVSKPGRIETYNIELTDDVVAKRCPKDLNFPGDLCILLPN